MKTRTEFITLKNICFELESYQYPGYPFSIYGVIDFKTRDYWVSGDSNNYVANSTWDNFASQFEINLLYHILGSDLANKQTWLQDGHMENYRVFLDAPWDDDNFYIDNQELTRLYFAVYAAIREYQNTDKLMLFMYDGDSEYVDVLLFDTIDEIDQYYKEYINPEEEEGN